MWCVARLSAPLLGEGIDLNMLGTLYGGVFRIARMTRSDINAEADYKTCRMGNADKSGLLGRTAIPPSPSIVNPPPMLALGSRESRKVTAISLSQQSAKHILVSTSAGSYKWRHWRLGLQYRDLLYLMDPSLCRTG